MSEHNEAQSQYPQIRIVYRTDGTAQVNGVPVRTEPGGHVRDAAYAAAVALVAHCPGPVVATSVEADGAVYRITLYPARCAVTAGDPDAQDAPERRLHRMFGIVGDGARRGPAAMPNRLPVLRLGWLLTAVFGCVLVASVTAVLLEDGGPSVVRLSVEQQTEPADSDLPQAAGSGPITATVAAGKAIGDLAQGAVAAIPRSGNASPAAVPAGTGGATATATATAAPPPGPPVQSPSQASGGPQGSAQPDPAPAHGPVTVREVTLALLGGDKKNPSATYVITVSASDSNPVTLTYSYSGSTSTTATTRSMTLSGETEYAVTGEIPGRPYCGQTVSVRAWTSPAAGSGPVSAVTMPGC